MSIVPDFNKFTYDDYVLIPSDRKRHEIVDGDHFVNPAPDLYHQTISKRIEFQLIKQIEDVRLGWVFNAPVDVQLTQFDVVQPDLVVVLKDRKKVLTKTKIDGAPNLVFEILSPGNPQHDRELKKKLYQRCQIPEYWIVDPEECTIQQFVLENDVYVEQPSTGAEIPLAMLPGASIDTHGMWDFDF